jgi:hypothetical protein
MEKLESREAKRCDFVVLLLLIVAADIYARLTTRVYIGRDLFGAVAFCLPGTVYLGLRSPKPWKKIFVATLLFGFLFGCFFEFIQQSNQSYVIAATVIPKIFGFLSLDFVIWHILMAAYVFTFYEHFINKTKDDAVSPRAKVMIIITLIVLAATIVLHYAHPNALSFKYAYAYFGTVAVIAPFALAYKKPGYIRDLTLIAPFFLAFYFVIEWIGVPRQWWIYPSHHYLGWVSVQSLHFPIEELIFWMLLYPAALVAYYKIFVDR